MREIKFETGHMVYNPTYNQILQVKVSFPGFLQLRAFSVFFPAWTTFLKLRYLKSSLIQASKNNWLQKLETWLFENII